MVATLKIIEKLNQKIIRAMCFYNFQNIFLIILSESDPKIERNGRIAQNPRSFMVATLKIVEKLKQKIIRAMCFYNFQNNFLIILSESDPQKERIWMQ